MKSVQFTKKLNNTELGKSGTHDTYVLVPQDVDVTDIFPEVNTIYEFVDKESNEKVSIRRTQGREKRIVGLGPYYQKKELFAGDEIIFECRTMGSSMLRYIDCYKKNNRILLQKASDGFEILTPERIDLLNNEVRNDGKTVELKFLSSKKKRADSPETTNFFELYIDGIERSKAYSYKEIIELYISNNSVKINKFRAWKKEIMETEE